MSLNFTKKFEEKFKPYHKQLVEHIYDKYFKNLIDDIRVTYTSQEVWGMFDHDANTVLFRHITPHTIAHEFMHAVAHDPNSKVPTGEKACDIFTCALGIDVCDHAFYLDYEGIPEIIMHEVSKEAIEKRSNGLRNYIVWANSEFRKRTDENLFNSLELIFKNGGLNE